MANPHQDKSWYSLGTKIIVAIAVLSSIGTVLWPARRDDSLKIWTFTRHLAIVYEPILAGYNAKHAGDPDRLPVVLDVLQPDALVQRTLTGFWADTPMADVVQVEIKWVGQFLTGPIEEVGFVDMTDIMREEGMLETINPASFAPWSSRGRIFGIPMGAPAVQLCYRKDIVDEAGIDMSQIETWDDFERVIRPLVADTDGDGYIDRYAINFWPTQTMLLELLMLQADGGAFRRDQETGTDELIVNAPQNAQVLARGISWCVGPDRIAVDSPELTPGGNQMRLEGKIVCVMMPDWLAGVWKMDMQPLSGKVRVMPLPAWEPDGRRSSVWGGSMTAIPKSTPHFEQAWEVAKRLAYQPEAAEENFRAHLSIGGIRSLWTESFYHEPIEYFGGQHVGTTYIEAAKNMPLNNSSPYNQFAIQRIGQCALALMEYAKTNKVYDREGLVPEAQRLLDAAHEEVAAAMARNVFLKPEPAE